MNQSSEEIRALTNAGVAEGDMDAAVTALREPHGLLQAHVTVLQRLASRGQCVKLFQQILEGRSIPFQH